MRELTEKLEQWDEEGRIPQEYVDLGFHFCSELDWALVHRRDVAAVCRCYDDDASEPQRVQRVQRKRHKGFRLPAGVLSVTRPGRWGNPFSTAAEFRKHLVLALHSQLTDKTQEAERMRRIAGSLEELRGKSLACWCPVGAECHADVLIEFANR